MERELWTQLYHLVRTLDKSLRPGTFHSFEIIGVYLWGVLHERSTSWACKRKNWPNDEPFAKHLPSQSTMSRRMRSSTCEQLLLTMGELFYQECEADLLTIKIIDAKPLPVGPYSKACDATWGRGAGCRQKGYKLFTVWGEGPMPLAWCLAPMNVPEKIVGRWLMEDLPGGGFMLGDTIYDTNPMYEAAGQNGYQLLTPAFRGKTLGHRKQSCFRKRGRNLMGTRYGKRMFRGRTRIERNYGNLTSFGGGLACLPAWVRTMPRVRPWIQGKFLINALRIQKLQGHSTIAAA